MGEEIDVEHVGAVVFFGGRQEVEQERSEARLVEHGGDVAVAGAVAAAPAAVGEHHDAGRPVGDGEMATQPDWTGEHFDLFVAGRWVVGDASA